MTEPRARWSETIAVFGGTFDPPHRGHREAVAGLFTMPGVREAWVIPTGTPADKPARIDAESRLQLARLNFLENDPEIPIRGTVRLDDRELRRAARTGLPSYSFDTLSELKREVPELAMVIGADRVATLASWYRFPEVLGLCHWIILERRPEGAGLARQSLQQLESSGIVRPARAGERADHRWLVPGSQVVLEVFETGARAISSTEIREQIALNGEPPAQSLTPAVSDQLKRKQLYGTSRQ